MNPAANERITMTAAVLIEQLRKLPPEREVAIELEFDENEGVSVSDIEGAWTLKLVDEPGLYRHACLMVDEQIRNP